MTEQAVVEAARADEQDGRDRVGSGTPVSDEALVADELLVEEVSIDGMCGVY
jgi:mycofactocin precursor